MSDQLDLLAGPGKGAKRKERALQDHDQHKAAAIGWLRKRLAELYRERCRAYRRSTVYVTADDARDLYAKSSFPPAYSANRTFFGSIFRGAEWEVVGRAKSLYPANNCREIKTWRHVG
jgi:hypothetical protein